MSTFSPAPQITDKKSHSPLHLIKQGNLVFLHAPKKAVPEKSKYLVKKNQLDYPVLIKVFYPAENRYSDPLNLSIRLNLLKIPHAVHRNDPYALYIDKTNLNSLAETVSCHSSNSWQVVTVS